MKGVIPTVNYDGWYFFAQNHNKNREYYIQKDIFTKGGRVLQDTLKQEE